MRINCEFQVIIFLQIENEIFLFKKIHHDRSDIFRGTTMIYLCNPSNDWPVHSGWDD